MFGAYDSQAGAVDVSQAPNLIREVESAEQIAGRNFPDSDRLIVAATRELLAVRAKGNRRNYVAMTVQRADLFAGVAVPDLDGVVMTGSGAEFAIGCAGNAEDITAVRFALEQLFL